jgi:hypothetical protein
MSYQKEDAARTAGRCRMSDTLPTPTPPVQPEIGTPAPTVDGNNLPSKVPDTTAPAMPRVTIRKKLIRRTRYTWNIYVHGNDVSPAFTISLIENDPESVGIKFWEVLSANTAAHDLQNYKPRLKSIEVLD